MKLIFKYIFKYKKIIFIYILSVFFVACGEIIIPYEIGKLLFEKQHINNFSQIIFLFIILVFLAICGNVIINFCTAKLSSLVFTDLSTDIFKKIQTFSIIDMQNAGISNLMNQTTFNVYQILNFMTTFYRAILFSPIMLIISLGFMYWISSLLSCFMLLLIPFFILILFFLMRKNYLLSLQQHQQIEEINNKIRENVTGVKVIRSLNQIPFEVSKFDKINSNYKNLIIKLFLSVLFIDPFFYLLLNLSIIFTIGLGSYMMKTGTFAPNLRLSDLYNFINLQYHVLFSILNFLLLFTMFPKTLVSMNKIENLLFKQSSVQNPPIALIQPLNKICTIVFKNVFFSYSPQSEMILQNINLEVNRAEVIAFVGATGSGKTTLINLIPRLMDPTEGIIEINGIDIKKYNLFDLRKKISFVSQKNILFKGTIFSNLLFGNENATEQQIWEKAMIAQSYDFIQQKNQKLREPVEELGANFSGGQKQRLSITRAFLKEPDVYIFDDSFSALDYKTDSTLRKVFFENKKDAIVFIVAQRLTSILNADQIIVLDHGKIVSKGKHHELYQTCNVYRKIVVSQKIQENQI
ncbi:MAG: ABC transporter ATP-binding protein [Vigna little leaf phytoplasma]|nr:ABC transporter ATP-binding protein [Vigna little leaf phytoplasma]